ncbi:MAG TPA: dTDP-4-dehydrorhamnose reductase [Gemmatimonadaceae bacterium]|nr:dTDP-4-dehydrorhamnose reductase [Gemmatimonadaceae bacterium]
MRLFVTGASGMVGSEIARQAREAGFHCSAFTHHDLDITDAAAVSSAVRASSPDVVINAAAYTAVDMAEQDEVRAMLVNRTGAGNVAAAANDVGASVVHISTDYVFDGETNEAYRPTDATNPINAYGRSKLGGEIEVASACARHVIVRASWVYSHDGHNFVRTMLRLADSGKEIKVVDDQQGAPTAAADLAAALLRVGQTMCDRSVAGTFHFTNAGVTTWYNFANAIFEMRGLSGVTVRPISTAEFPTPARRPRWSVLDCSTFEKEFEMTPRTWRSALRETLNRIQ